MTVPAFETTFAVPMTCEACIKDIEGSLSSLSGTSARSSPMHVIRLT
jgi:copper chaperone CopZ